LLKNKYITKITDLRDFWFLGFGFKKMLFTQNKVGPIYDEMLLLLLLLLLLLCVPQLYTLGVTQSMQPDSLTLPT